MRSRSAVGLGGGEVQICGRPGRRCSPDLQSLRQGCEHQGRTVTLTLCCFIPRHRGELLSLRDIERLHKKPKSDKETRLATAMVSGHAILIL